ncbi:SID1 transmembrane family member 1-like [Ostrea edulis]|uniref:SID1 transmembrane family member 1-like n=1 Tax=Ostrea edulis TaxID=37623 RepID=UPI0020941849|nr:SID1 transmembrane family member 1-like [Ostrea edulis]
MTVRLGIKSFVFGIYVVGIAILPIFHTFEKIPDVTKADFNKIYSSSINTTNEAIYEFTYSEMKNRTTALRITTELVSKDYVKGFPTIVVVRQQQRTLSWTIPMYLEYSDDATPYETVSRTLCPLDASHRSEKPEELNFFVDFSTFSKDPLNFTLKATKVEDFQVSIGVPKEIEITPSEPKFYMYSFPEGIDTVMVHATSKDESCAVMSIQKIQCPVYDLNTNVEFEGKYQTMTKQAAIQIQKADYPRQAFYVVFILKPLDKDCSSQLEAILPAGVKRAKNVTLEIKKTISGDKYYWGMLFAVALFGAFYLVAFLIGIFYHGCSKHRGIWMIPESHEEKLDQNDSGDLDSPVRPLNTGSESRTYGSIHKEADDDHNDLLSTMVKDSTSSSARNVSNNLADGKSVSSIDSEEIDFLNDADEEKDVFRTKTELFVYDLSRKKYKKQARNYTIYWRNLLAIAIFYGLPVLQLVFTYQKVLNVTGDLDICYYNFNCAHPWGQVSSFNNIFSNIGYVSLGILFLILVYRRKLIYDRAVQLESSMKKEMGIPQHFGLFFAMGIALIMEGIMSACYHVCPTYSNFQFDTSFMYIIACLCMLKIYQTRHPDISAKAHTSYLLMAFVIFIAVIGVIYGTSIFWILFACVYMFFYLVLSVHIYFMGRWKIDRGICRRLFVAVRYDLLRCRKPMYPDRMALLVIGNVINWSIAIYGAVNHSMDFATLLLGIFIGNLMIYCTFYIIMKLRYKEKIHRLAIFVIVSAAVVWGFALYFFFSNLTSSLLTPSRSREGNRDCLLVEFYDAHDIWHFLSSIALFFSFLVLLTLDDDMFSTRRDQIHMFKPLGKLFGRKRSGKKGRKNTDSSENDNNYETDDKSRPGACRIARTPVHEDAVVHLSAVQPGLCLSCSKDKTAALYDYDNHNLIDRWEGHERELTKIRNGKTCSSIFSASRDKSIKMWKSGNPHCLQEFNGHELVVTAIDLNHDDTWLCSGSRDNHVKLWDVNTAQCFLQSNIHRNLVTDLKFVPGTHLLVQTGEDKEVRLFDTRTMQVVHSYPRKHYIQMACDVSADGLHCITCSNGFGGNGCEVTLWDIRGRKIVHEYRDHGEAVESCIFLPSIGGKQLIATTSRDTTVRLWDMNTKECLSCFPVVGSGPLTSIICYDDLSLCVSSFNSGIISLKLSPSDFTLQQTGQF